jgi:hypothetical protein
VQPVVGQVIDHRHVAVLEAGPRPHQQVRGPGHRLHAAGHDDLELAGPDQLVGQRDGVQTGQTDLVDRDGRDVHRDAGLDRRLPGRNLADARLQHLAHDHVLDVGPGQAGPLDGAADRDPAQLGRRDRGERTVEAADRGSGPGDDD